MNTRNLSNQKGFSIWEILIGGIVFGLAASFLIPILTETKDELVMVNKEVSQMQSTLQKIEGRYFGEPITSSLDNQEIIEGKMLSKSYRHNASSFDIYNSWNGVITITGIDENGLEWKSEDVPSNICPGMITAAEDLGFRNVEVNGTNIQYSTNDNADITAACDTDEDTVEITWTREAS